MSTPAILCVDDEAIILLGVVHELKKHYKDKFIYESALSPTEGLQILKALHERGIPVLLVLSDWAMPGGDGREFLEQVQELYPTVHTVLMSGHPEVWLSQQVENTAIEIFFSKPVRMSALFQYIDSIYPL